MIERGCILYDPVLGEFCQCYGLVFVMLSRISSLPSGMS